MGGHRLFRNNRLGRQGVVLSRNAQRIQLGYRGSRGLGAYGPKLESMPKGIATVEVSDRRPVKTSSEQKEEASEHRP